MINRMVLLLITACSGPAFLCASPAMAEPNIQFTAAENTGLSEILKARRATLEKRQGKPLTGHQWWLWGLGSFDYDRDGDVDFIVGIHGSTNGVILRNELMETGKLTFVDVTEELGVDGAVPSTDNYPLVWDFDGDGYLDIAGLLDDTQTPCLLNDGGQRFTKASFSLHPINYPDGIRDLNGDGYIDIFQSKRGKRVQFLYDAKTASFERSETPANWPDDLPEALRGELENVRSEARNRFVQYKFFHPDLNGDGRADLIVRAFGSYSGDRLGWYRLADHRGSYQKLVEELVPPRDGAPLLVADIDHDGDIDILTASGEAAGLYLNDGQGKFTYRPGPLTDFVKQRCPYLHVVKRVDFDYDGDLDLAVSNRRYGREIVFENGGEGNFTPVLSVRGWDADPLVLRDVNRDGLVDVIVGGAGEKENIGVYLNTTPKPGNYCLLYPRLKSPNVYAVGTLVEVFHAGTLGELDVFPVLTMEAPLDGSPIPVGLGKASSFDLRVTLPDGATWEENNVIARPKLFVTESGIATSAPK